MNIWRCSVSPIFFVAVSGITIALNVSRAAQGEYCWDLGWFYLYTSRSDLWYAVSLTCKAFGAVSAMYFLTLTTPACEIGRRAAPRACAQADYRTDVSDLSVYFYPA